WHPLPPSPTLFPYTTLFRSRANALVAANHSGFVNSRNLLVGVGAGSLALALALGLLLSWSVVAPLKRTQQRLATIAGGDFGGHRSEEHTSELQSRGHLVCRL